MPERKTTKKATKKAAPKAAKKASTKKATPKAAKKASAKKAAPKAAKKAASKKAETEDAAPAEEVKAKGSGAFLAKDVNMGSIMALRPRVHTSFPQKDFLEARRELSDESYETAEEAARAVAEKALGTSNDPKKKRGQGKNRRR